MFDELETNFHRVQLRLTLIFSLFFALIIISYSILIVNSHHTLKYNFQNNVKRELRPDHAAPPLVSDPICQPPERPYVAPDEEDSGVAGVSQALSHGFKNFDYHLYRNLIIFGGGIWLLISVLGYFFIGWLLRPVQESTRAQQDFLANASHELKTPITTIKTELSLIEPDKLKKDLRDSLTTIQTETNTLQTLVEKLLLIISHQQLPSQKTSVDVSSLGKKLCRRFTKTYAGKPVTFACQSAANYTLTTDECKLTQLLELLLDNAGKYSHAHTAVTLQINPDPARDKKLHLSIINQGLGIADSQKEAIWERFYRVTDKAVQSQSGSGLGLAIARDLARDLGGTLVLADGDPAHTEFRLTLSPPSKF